MNVDENIKLEKKLQEIIQQLNNSQKDPIKFDYEVGEKGM
jgi:hypothetical protein